MILPGKEANKGSSVRKFRTETVASMSYWAIADGGGSSLAGGESCEEAETTDETGFVDESTEMEGFLGTIVEEPVKEFEYLDNLVPSP